MNNILSCVLLVPWCHCYRDGSITGGPQMFKYNPQTAVWTETAHTWHYLTSQVHRSACTLKGQIYVIGIVPNLSGV